MTKIKFDKRNYRKHDDRNKRLIRKSLEECGAGRSVVIDSEGELIAGNGVYEQAQALGMKVREVETDGTELVVVKRTDLKTDDEKRRTLAMADNATSDTSEFDFGLLTEDFEVQELKDWGVEVPDFVNEEDIDGGGADGALPDVDRMFNNAKYNSLQDGLEDGTGMRQMTFLFDADQYEHVLGALQVIDKKELAIKIVELCRSVEAK